MALAKHHHDIDKRQLENKAFGCYPHRKNRPDSPFLLGFSGECLVPISRLSSIDQTEIDARPGLRTLVTGAAGGPAIVQDIDHSALYVLNHFEYDSDTLQQEYQRDSSAGVNAKLPVNYFPEDNPAFVPMNKWRSDGQMLFSNWLAEISAQKRIPVQSVSTTPIRSSASGLISV
jgi:homoserine O-succinyltransferase/O-acetyltransferase